MAITWATHATVGGKTGVTAALCVGSGKLIAVGPNFIITSANDGSTWTDRTPASVHAYNSLISDGATVMAIGPDTSNQVAVSTDDGHTWTLHAIDAGNAFAGQDVCAPAVGTFVAIANNTATANKRIAVSTDSGVTWALKTTPAAWSGSSGAAQSIAAKDATHLVAWDANNPTDTITSSDGGSTWTKHAGVLSALTPAGVFPSNTIRFSSGLGQYIINGFNGSSQAVVYQSSDGITWSQIGTTITTYLGWYGFAIADAFGGFFGHLPMTSAFSPTPTIVGWSTDAGTTWTTDNTTYSPGASGIWGPACWDPSTGTVAFFDFDSATVLLGTTAPTLSGVSPAFGTARGGTVVTITGTALTGATSVTFGGTAAVGVTVSSDTTITCVTPAHTSALVDVAVTTPGGTVTSTNAFTFVSVERVSRETGTVAGGVAVTITGYGFTAVGASQVLFDTTAATDVVVVSNTSITAVTPPHASGTVDVTVVGVDTGEDLYTYTLAVPQTLGKGQPLPPMPIRTPLLQRRT